MAGLCASARRPAFSIDARSGHEEAARTRPSPNFRSGLHGGIGWFDTFFQEDDDANELRPWVGVRFAGPRPGGWLIQNYFRFEFRVFGFGSGGDSDSDMAWLRGDRHPDRTRLKDEGKYLGT